MARRKKKRITTNKIEKLYTDPNYSGAFSGKESFYRSVKDKDKKVKRSQLNKVLLKSDAYTLHKPVRKPKRYRRIYSKGINHHYQADLVDLSAYSDSNDGYKWIMTFIDTFSKKLWVLKLKNKSAKTVYDALKPLLTKLKPQKFETDEGKEFTNKQLQQLLKELNIKHYSVSSDQKCAIAERVNRTLKTKMFRSFTARGSHRWVDILDKLVHGYNNSFHRSIKMKPSEVTKDNESLVRKTLYPPEPPRDPPKLFLGDTVRISGLKGIFQKGYEQTWSYEIFTVSEVRNTNPVTYRVKDFTGEELKGSFYESQLQKVDKSNNIYAIDKVLKTRKVRGKIQYFVSFKGYPDSANRWVDDLYDI